MNRFANHFYYRETTIEDNEFLAKTRCEHFCGDKYLKGTVVNRTCLSIKGHFKMSYTVPLSFFCFCFLFNKVDNED